MTALGKIFRTTVFKLSIVYLLLFALSCGAVITWMAWNVRRLVDEQIATAINAEINGLSEQYTQGGVRRLVFAVDVRTRRPGASLYLLTNFQGLPLAGNVTELPPGTLDRTGLIETAYQRPDSQSLDRHALARIFELPGGFRLLVGRDVEDRETLSNIVSRGLIIALIWLIAIGTLGGIFVAHRVLRRVDAMTESAQAIMQGNISQRIPVAGSNDELDRLAVNLNAMLERISELMAGLKEVSDNIAHDLRTPLTRLRSRAEDALRTAENPGDYRASLERVIEDADQLIRVFNALLLIARTEAGAGRDKLEACDLSRIVSDIAELYEPSAEDAGLRIETDIAEGLFVECSRELLSQAIANLIDNAIKYGAPLPLVESGPRDIRLTTRRRDGFVEIVVADHGPGIPIADRTRVLDRFVRLEGSRSQAGSGLGLSLAAAVARLHGGDLRLEDNGPGLRAVLSLPAAGDTERTGKDDDTSAKQIASEIARQPARNSAAIVAGPEGNAGAAAQAGHPLQR